MPDDPQQLSSEQQFDALMRSGASVSGVSAPPPTMPNYEQMLESAAAKHGVDYNLARALMRHESAGNPHAVSNKGAQGLMQLMPETARGLGVTDPFDPEQNIDAGIRYLKQQMDNFSGDPVLALAAYNAGPEAVRKYGGVPPYQETQDYVSTIMGRYRQGDSEQHLEQILNQPPQEQAEGGASDSEQQFDQMMATEPAGPPKPQFTISATKEDQPPAHPLARAGWWLEKHIGDAEVPGMTNSVGAPMTMRDLWEKMDTPIGMQEPGNRKEEELKVRAASWRGAFNAIFTGLGDNIMGLLAPKNMAIMAGIEVLGPETGIRALVDAGFSYQMGKAAWEQVKAGKAAYDYGDAESAIRYWVSAPVSTLFAALSGKGALENVTRGAQIRQARARALGHLNEVSHEKYELPWRDLTKEQKADVTYSLGDKVKAQDAAALGAEPPNPIAERDIQQRAEKRATPLMGETILRGQEALRGEGELEAETPASLAKKIEAERIRQRYADEADAIIEGAPEKRPYEKGPKEIKGKPVSPEDELLINAPELTSDERAELREQLAIKEAKRQLRDERKRAAEEAQKQLERQAFRVNDQRAVQPRAGELDFQRQFGEMEPPPPEVPTPAAESAPATEDIAPKAPPTPADGLVNVQRAHDMERTAETLRKAAEKAPTPVDAEELAREAQEAEKAAQAARIQRETVEREILLAKQAKANQSAGEPIKEIAGRTVDLVIPGAQGHGVHYAIVSAADLKPSHDPGTWKGRENAYQPRTSYGENKSVQQEVILRSQNIDPGLVLTDNPTPETGPPIIRNDGLVAGGNSRAMALQLAYKGGFGKAYYEALVQRAHLFGIESIPPLDTQPVLVRVFNDIHTDRAQMNRIGDELNFGSSRGYTEAERGAASAKKLSQKDAETIAGLLAEAEEDYSLRDLMRERNDYVANILLNSGIVEPTKAIEYVDADRKLTEKGKRLFELAVKGKVIDDPTVIDRVAKEIPSTDKKVDVTLSLWMRLRARNDAWDIHDYLTDGLRLLLNVNDAAKELNNVKHDLSINGRPTPSSSVELYLYPEKYPFTKMELTFEEPIRNRHVHPITEAIAKLLEEKPANVKSALQKYVDAADKGDNKAQTGFGFGGSQEPWEAFEQYIGKQAGVEIDPEEWGRVLAKKKAKAQSVEAPGPGPAEPSAAQPTTVAGPPPEPQVTVLPSEEKPGLATPYSGTERRLPENDEQRRRAEVFQVRISQLNSDLAKAETAEQKADIRKAISREKQLLAEVRGGPPAAPATVDVQSQVDALTDHIEQLQSDLADAEADEMPEEVNRLRKEIKDAEKNLKKAQKGEKVIETKAATYEPRKPATAEERALAEAHTKRDTETAMEMPDYERDRITEATDQQLRKWARELHVSPIPQDRAGLEKAVLDAKADEHIKQLAHYESSQRNVERIRTELGAGSEFQKKVAEVWPSADELEGIAQRHADKTYGEPLKDRAAVEKALTSARNELAGEIKHYESIRQRGADGFSDYTLKFAFGDAREELQHLHEGPGNHYGSFASEMDRYHSRILYAKGYINALLRELGQKPEFQEVRYSEEKIKRAGARPLGDYPEKIRTAVNNELRAQIQDAIKEVKERDQRVPTIELPWKQIAEWNQKSSTSSLGDHKKPRIREILYHDGKGYVVTGSAGNADSLELSLARVYPAEQWKGGEPKGERGYYGRRYQYKGKEYVLGEEVNAIEKLTGAPSRDDSINDVAAHILHYGYLWPHGVSEGLGVNRAKAVEILESLRDVPADRLIVNPSDFLRHAQNHSPRFNPEKGGGPPPEMGPTAARLMEEHAKGIEPRSAPPLEPEPSNSQRIKPTPEEASGYDYRGIHIWKSYNETARTYGWNAETADGRRILTTSPNREGAQVTVDNWLKENKGAAAPKSEMAPPPAKEKKNDAIKRAKQIKELHAAIADAPSEIEDREGQFRDLQYFIDKAEKQTLDANDFDGMMRMGVDFSEALSEEEANEEVPEGGLHPKEIAYLRETQNLVREELDAVKANVPELEKELAELKSRGALPPDVAERHGLTPAGDLKGKEAPAVGGPPEPPAAAQKLKVGDIVHVDDSDLPVAKIGKPNQDGLVDVTFERDGKKFAVAGIDPNNPFRGNVLRPPTSQNPPAFEGAKDEVAPKTGAEQQGSQPLSVKSLRTQLEKAFPKVSKDQREAAILLMKMRADKLGMSLDDFVAKHLAGVEAGGTAGEGALQQGELQNPTVFLVRHGETNLNDRLDNDGKDDGDTSAERIRGWADVPLNDNGRQKAVETGQKLAKYPITRIISSDLGRARETSELIRKQFGRDVPVEYTEQLRPMHWGDYTGQPVKEAIPAMEYYTEHPDEQVPGGESFGDFLSRWQGVLEHAQELAHQGEVPLIVGHARQMLTAPYLLSQGAEPIQQKGGPPPGTHVALENLGHGFQMTQEPQGWQGQQLFQRLEKGPRITGSGWLTKDGRFERLEGTELHDEAARRLKLASGEEIAIGNGHLRVRVSGANAYIEANKNDERTRGLIKTAVDNMPPGVRTVYAETWEPHTYKVIDRDDTTPSYEILGRKGNKIRARQGIDVERAKEAALHGKYANLNAQKMTIEMVQNAVDAVRSAFNRDKDFQGNITLETGQMVPQQQSPELPAPTDASGKHIGEQLPYVEISDNGPGMSAEQLATVFLDVYSTGKGEESGMAGGYGIAKATFQLGGKYFQAVSTVKDSDGKIHRYVIEGNPRQVQEGLDIVELPSEERPKGFAQRAWGRLTTKEQETIATQEQPKTGTTVRVFVDASKSGELYYAKEYFTDAAKASDVPGTKFQLKNARGIEDVKGGKTSELAKIDVPGAQVRLRSAPETPESKGYVTVYVTNEGLHQFTHHVYLGGEVSGMPEYLVADIYPTAKPNTESYPFTQDRERIKNDVDERLKIWVKKNLFEIARKRALEQLSKEWAQIKQHETPSGTRLHVYDEHGMMGDTVQQMFNDPYWHPFMDTVADIGDYLAKNFQTERGNEVEKFGLFFPLDSMEGNIRRNLTFGVNIPNPENVNKTTREAGRSEAIFLNPFGAAMRHEVFSELPKVDSAEKLGINHFSTLVHEFAHNKERGHGTSFEDRMAEIFAQIPRQVRRDFEDRLISALAGGGDESKIHPTFEKYLQRYIETRREGSGRARALSATGEHAGRVRGGDDLPGEPGQPDERLQRDREGTGTDDVKLLSSPWFRGLPAEDQARIKSDPELLQDLDRAATRLDKQGREAFDAYMKSDKERMERGDVSFSDYDKLFLQEVDKAFRKRNTLFQQQDKNDEQPVWLSRAREVVTERMKTPMSGEQLLGMLRNSGVKEDEIKWTGLDDFVKDKKRIQPAQVNRFLRENAVEIKDVVHGTDTQTEPHQTLSWVKIHAPEGGFDLGTPMLGRNEAYETYAQMESYNREQRVHRYGSRMENGEPTGYQILHFPDLNRWEVRDQDVGDDGELIEVADNYHDAQLAAQQHADETNRLDRYAKDSLKYPPSQYPSVWIPGGENPIELLLQVQPTHATDVVPAKGVRDPNPPTGNLDFHGGHFDEPNVLANVLADTRTIDGKKTLVINEVQSDWHRLGRKQGYKSGRNYDAELQKIHEEAKPYTDRGQDAPRELIDRATAIQDARLKDERSGVPDAPFKTDWHELAMKRMLRYAVENGYDRIAWSNGDFVKDKYDLSKHIDELRWNRRSGLLTAKKNGVEVFEKAAVEPADLERYVGKEVAQRLLEQNPSDADIQPGTTATVLRNGKLNQVEVVERYRAPKTGEWWKVRDVGRKDGAYYIVDRRDMNIGYLRDLDLKVGGEWANNLYDRAIPNFMRKYAGKWGGKVADVEADLHPGATGKFDEDSIPLHSVDITKEMRDSVMRGQYLFQGGGKGAVEFMKDGRAIIRGFESGDVSTLAHETAHVFRRTLEPGELNTANKLWGVSDGKWAVKHEEAFARDFERYLYDGKAPNAEAKTLFEKFRGWLRDVYTRLIGSSIAERLSAEKKAFFDMMLGGEPVEAGASKEESKVTPPAIAGPPEPRGPPASVEAPVETRKTTMAPPPEMSELEKRWASRREEPQPQLPLQQEGPPPAPRALSGDKNTVYTKADYEAARAAFRDKLGRLHLGLDPSMASDLMVIGGYHFERGARAFSEWAHAMLEDAGQHADLIRPHLKDIYNSLRDAGRERAAIAVRRGVRTEDQRILINRAAKAFGEIQQPSRKEVQFISDAPRIILPPGAEYGRTPDSDRERATPNAPPAREQLGGTRPPAGPGSGPGEPRAHSGPPPSRAAKPAEERDKVAAATRKALRGVEDIKMASAPKSGKPIYEEAAWRKRLEDVGLPENLPVPTVKLRPELRDRLGFPGQREATEVALSGLERHGGMIMATSTGTGKTYMGAAVVAQRAMEGANNILVLTKNRTLVENGDNGWLDVLRNHYGLDAEEIPSGVSAPKKPGIYVATHGVARLRKYEDFNWDLVVVDESGEARRWYAKDNRLGKKVRDITENAKQALYMSATPFHTPVELGYLSALHLWDDEGFAKWARQLGVTSDQDGILRSPPSPRKMAKIREQLIERGQFVNMDRNMEGYEAHFGMVPMTPDVQQGLKNIERAFQIAENYFRNMEMHGMIRAVLGNKATFTKNYIERARLPEAIELGKRLEKSGYKVSFFTENKREVDEVFDFLKPVDEGTGGELSKLLPKLPSVPDELEKAFGKDNLAQFHGQHSIDRENEKDAFLRGEKQHIYTTYASGGIGVSLHDKQGDAPRAVIHIGLPWSGVMFDQSVGRFWRFGTKSNVHSIFLTSDAAPEVSLVTQKLGPRLASLRAGVSGIRLGDAPVDVDGSIDYELGGGHRPVEGEFLRTGRMGLVDNWDKVKFPEATEAMNKGMKMPNLDELPEPSYLYQRDEAQKESDRIGKQVERETKGGGPPPAPGRGDPLSEAIQRAREVYRAGKPEQREALQHAVGALAEIDAEDVNGDATPVIRSRWQRTMDDLADVGETVSRGYSMVGINGRRVIQRLGGTVGESIVDDIHEYATQKGNIAGPWELKLFTARDRDKVTPDEFKQVWQAIESGTDYKLDPRLKRMADTVQGIKYEVQDRALQAGVEIEIREPDTGKLRYAQFPSQRKPLYMPHRYTKESLDEVGLGFLKDKIQRMGRQRVIDALMEKNGFNRTEAELTLNSMGRGVPLAGNVERPRELEMPGYRMDMGAFAQYIEEASEAIARTEIFGQRRKLLTGKLSLMEDQKNAMTIGQIMDSLLDRRLQSEDPSKFYRLASDWETVTKMTFSAIPHFFQGINASLRSNTMSALRGFKDVVTEPRTAYHAAMQAGAILEQMKQAEARNIGGHGRLAQKVLNRTGFIEAGMFSRAWSVATARNFLDHDVLPALLKDPQNAHYRRVAREHYGLSNAAMDLAIADKMWQPEDYMRAGKRLSDDTQFTFDPTELPPTWRAKAKGEPSEWTQTAFRLATILKVYAFKQGALMYDSLIREATKGNFRPWIPAMILFPAAGEIIGDIVRLAHGDTKRIRELFEDKTYEPVNILKRLAADFGYSGGHTLATALIESAGSKFRTVLEAAAGPWYADVAHATESTYRTIDNLLQGKTRQAGHEVKKEIRQTFVPAAPVVTTMENAGILDQSGRGTGRINGEMMPPPPPPPPPMQ